ncbi:hypothetical protein [Glutamicibacter protophormiae]|uniref:hypothetical protein n=1 Tax=Glutamicibacter protophormiae TaxID=37930 RepID=UPI003BB066E7
MNDFSSTPVPRPGIPGTPHGGAPQFDDQALEAVLSSLADHDITEHAGIYEQLLGGLQQELNRSEFGA